MTQDLKMDDVSEAEEIRRMLRESARDFAQSKLGRGRQRTLREQPPEARQDAWHDMAELGWTALLVDPLHGGSGLGLREMAIVLEELGRVAAYEPLGPCAVLAAKVIALSDQSALKSMLLEGLAQGMLRPAVAWQEAARLSSDDAAGSTRAERLADGWHVRGTKCFVQPGAAWSGLVLPANTEHGLTLFWVPRDTPGLEVRVLTLADGSNCADVTLNDVRVAAQYLLASPAVAGQALREAIDHARLAASAELLGVIRGALSMLFEHLRTREQFGVPIGSFQALRHRAADLFLQQELVSAGLEDVCSAVDAGAAHDLPMQAARVKARASSAALQVAKEAVQMHGAMGYTDECDVGLYLQRALVLSAWLGNASELRARHARACLLTDEAR